MFLPAAIDFLLSKFFAGFLEQVEVCMCPSLEKTRILLTETLLAQRARNFRDAV